MSAPSPVPTVVEVLRFEDLPLGAQGSRVTVWCEVDVPVG